MMLAPGEASDLHHHEHDYYLAISRGDLVAGVPPKDSGMDPSSAWSRRGGNTVPVPKGGTEWASTSARRPIRDPDRAQGRLGNQGGRSCFVAQLSPAAKPRARKVELGDGGGNVPL